MAELSPNLINLLDKKMQIIVASDNLSVRIKLAKFKWPAVKAGEVVKYLETKNIRFGLNKDIIKEVISNRDKEFIVAEGVPPVAGTDGSFEMKYHVPAKVLTPKQLPTGEVDHRELDAIICVQQDEILYQLTPAIEGIPGTNVYGELQAPEEVKQPDIQPGENTYINQEDNTIRAKIGGLPILDSCSISVNDTIKLDQDIDYSIGNISVPCNLIINGSVHEGFTVSTGGNLKIRNEIDNAFVHCGGNLTVGQGVNNKSTGKIYVEGNMQCKYLNSANLWINGSLFVDREILFSNIVCNTDVICTKEEGVLIGGILTLENNLIVNEIGTKHEAASTRITLCDMEDHIAKADAVEKERIELDQKLIEMLKEIKGIQEYLESLTITSEEYKEFEGIYERYLTDANQQKKKINDIVAYREELKLLLKSKKSGEVQVRQTIYPGVRIKIKDAVLLTKHEEKRILFFYNAKNRSIDTKLI